MREFLAHYDSSLSSPLQFSPHSGVGVRESADLERTRKNPIRVRAKDGHLLAQLHPLHEFIRNGEQSAGAISLNVIHVLLEMPRSILKLAVEPVHIRPSQSQALRDAQTEARISERLS